MKAQSRAVFLLFVAAAGFHLPTKTMLVLILGYLLFEQVDNVLARRTVDRIVADELYGWTVSPDDPHYEVKDEVERVRLTGNDQIIVTRITELIRRIHMG